MLVAPSELQVTEKVVTAEIVNHEQNDPQQLPTDLKRGREGCSVQ